MIWCTSTQWNDCYSQLPSHSTFCDASTWKTLSRGIIHHWVQRRHQHYLSRQSFNTSAAVFFLPVPPYFTHSPRPGNHCCTLCFYEFNFLIPQISSEIIWYLSFSVWLVSLIMSSRFICAIKCQDFLLTSEYICYIYMYVYVVCVVYLMWACVYLCFMNMCMSHCYIHSSISHWAVFIYWLMWIMLQWTSPFNVLFTFIQSEAGLLELR